ncbi:LPXTG cell wall anchor domain-containing protein [Paenibacillus wynnii]|uniref:LPXTG cell wall anchor domain-containing protein n=1 Tax=Paenibacillus wynnii TaxID=268407 RepID=UPI00278D7CA1|nr:LPXTG cell wall anchor domain-containing protein [Paenibacillus wynnii]MDQ0194512.1 LPXTG-motif cell wall-anchored protein [Paenibacillus wynnii]
MVKRRLSILVIIVMFIAQYTYGLGVPAQVKAEGTGETTSVTSAVYEISSNIVTSVSLSVYDPDGQIDPGPVYEQGSSVTLDYTWALPNGHGYHSGDYFTFQLPAQFKLFNDIQGSLESDEGTVGTFIINQSTHKVIMTFNSYIQDHDNVHGTLRINTKFDEQVIKENVEQQILFPITDGVQTFTLIFKPSGATIDKKGLPQGFNAKKITWTVDVNKKLDTVESAMVTDPIPAGLSLVDVGADVSVYRLNLALNGTGTKGDLVPPTDYSAEVTNGILKVSFNSTLTSAYRIEYTSSITDETKKSFVNKATFSGKDLAPVDSTATVTVARGENLNKYVTGYDWGKQIISWAIDYNYSEKEIAQGNAILTDLFTNTQDLVEGSLKVYPVTFDSAGNATKGTVLTEDIDYSLGIAEGVDKTGFKLIFESDISSAYHVEYQTKSAVRILNNTTITNTVSNSTYSDDATQVIRPTVIYKNLNGVNYNTKTADWKITINGDNYPMGNVEVTDTFPEGGLKFIPGTLVVRDGLGNLVNASEYDLDYINPVQPNYSFKVSFHSMIRGSYTISYSVEFNNEWITTNTEQFHNTALINWVDDSLVTHSASAMGLFDPRDEVKNNGFKFGSYNAATKEITWTVGVNYNGRTLDDARVSDLLKAPQTLLENSIKVFKMNIAVNGTPTQGDEVNLTNYSVETVANDTLLNVKLGSINSAYYVVFKTSLEGKLTSSKVENKANLYDGQNLKSKDLKATVNIPYGGEIVDKNGIQAGDKIKWTLPINRGQSYIKNAVITDTPSSNQKLILNSFHLYPTTVGSNGIPVMSTTELVRGTDKDYTLDFFTDASGKQTFVLKFNKDIKTPYILLYQSLIAANHGERVTNTAKLTGDNVTLVSREITKLMIVGVSSGSGTGSGERSTLTVKKVDSENSTVVLSGAVFNLYRISNAERILIDTQTTQPNGTAVFSSILSGNYILKEMTAPDGYILDSQERAVTLSPGANVVLTVTNKKPVVVPTPTPTTVTASPTPTSTTETASPTPTSTTETASPTPTSTTETASPTPTSTTETASPTPTTSTIPGEIVIVESAVPAGPGVVQTTQPTSSPVVQEVPDDNVPVGGIDIDEDDVPKGTVTDPSDTDPDVQKLPKTGEESSLPLYLMGMGLIVAGYVLNRVFKRGKRSE